MVLALLFSIFFSHNFTLFVLSTFFVSFANGMVEAAYNPMIADMYEGNAPTMLNRFHVWFPGAGHRLGWHYSLLITALAGK